MEITLEYEFTARHKGTIQVPVAYYEQALGDFSSQDSLEDIIAQKAMDAIYYGEGEVEVEW